jgi:hypothetical protein
VFGVALVGWMEIVPDAISCVSPKGINSMFDVCIIVVILWVNTCFLLIFFKSAAKLLHQTAKTCHKLEKSLFFCDFSFCSYLVRKDTKIFAIMQIKSLFGAILLV